MHLPDGVVHVGLAAGGYAGAVLLAALSLRRISRQPDPVAQVPRAAMLTAVFFVASLVHIPMPPTSVHLFLSGLVGILLGWMAFPVILIGLFFQAVMFGHGGITTLGLNGLILGLPALGAAGLWRLGRGASRTRAGAMGLAFTGAAGAVLLGVVLFASILLAGLPAAVDRDLERRAVLALATAHGPLALIEGLVTAATIGFLHRAGSDLLRGG
ncbi:MAG: cobalt transporter CbiM [Candidatus Competibacteraceae bacterium]|nr:MAG: cobalt transporter CbiM [Candidatus Competibacteraceae bacterium]